jgi:hypothetical protein
VTGTGSFARFATPSASSRQPLHTGCIWIHQRTVRIPTARFRVHLRSPMPESAPIARTCTRGSRRGRGWGCSPSLRNSPTCRGPDPGWTAPEHRGHVRRIRRGRTRVRP